METPYLDKMIDDLQNHIEWVETVSFSGISETRKELKEYEAIKEQLTKFNNVDLASVSQQRELLNDFVRKYNASTEKFEGISEDSVDCYFRGIL